MSAQIKMPQSGGNGIGKLAGLIAGASTGGFGLGLGTVGGAALGASKVGPLVQDVSNTVKLAKMPTDDEMGAPGTNPTGVGGSYGLGGQQMSDALSRRLQTPQNKFSLGLGSLNDPSVPDGVRSTAAPYYLQGSLLNPSKLFNPYGG